MGWKPFSFETIDLAALDDKVGGETGLVYSTAPAKAISGDGQAYIVKGPEPNVVFAELAGCVIANAIGITVPAVRACRSPVGILAGSVEVSGVRLVAPWLRKRHKVTNFDEIFDVIVADVWLGNVDRNMGNVIGNPTDGDKIEFVFIDFEKSSTLRPNPFINTRMIAPRQLWPRDELGGFLREIRPLGPPPAIVHRILQVDEGTCSGALRLVSEALGGIEWADNSTDLLMRRARQIQQLAEAVWNS